MPELNKESQSSEETNKLQNMLEDKTLFMSSDEIMKDPDILRHLDGEVLKYAERILKFNEYNWK